MAQRRRGPKRRPSGSAPGGSQSASRTPKSGRRTSRAGTGSSGTRAGRSSARRRCDCGDPDEQRRCGTAAPGSGPRRRRVRRWRRLVGLVDRHRQQCEDRTDASRGDRDRQSAGSVSRGRRRGSRRAPGAGCRDEVAGPRYPRTCRSGRGRNGVVGGERDPGDRDRDDEVDPRGTVEPPSPSRFQRADTGPSSAHHVR